MENLFEYVLEQIKRNNAEECYNYLNNTPNIESNLLQDTLDYLAEHLKPREINTIDDLAKLLDGNMNGGELKNPYNIDIEKLCKEKKWIVLFPYSDDNLEIRGYIDDEIGAWDGIHALIYQKGEFYPEDLEEETFKKSTENMIYGLNDTSVFDTEVEDGRIGIDVQWCPDDKAYTWYMISKFKNVAYFDIHDEDDDVENTWAHCCIIDLSSKF